MPRALECRKHTPSVKRARFMTCSASTSDFETGSQDQERSTPSYNHASSRCPEPFTERGRNGDPELNVRPLWLDANIAGRFLLLEDVDTGDILMPLSRLKELLGDNYSRCLNTADSRFVYKNKEADFGVYDSAPHIYWRWPFESPAHVKTTIRQELRDQSTGHIRLVPLPVVHNAMSKVVNDSQTKKRDDSRVTPKFLAVQSAVENVIQASNYAPLLSSAIGATQREPWDSWICSSRDPTPFGNPVLFAGPRSTALTAAKYMTTHKLISRKKATQEVRTPGQHQELNEIADLREEMSNVQTHLAHQARTMEGLEEALRETKTMFSRLFQIFTSEPHPDAVFSQVRDCINGDQDWSSTCLQGRYSSDSTPRSQVSGQVCTPYSSETPSHSTYHPLKFAAMRRQHSMACLPAMPMNQQMTVPVHNNPYPPVASKTHHLTFSSSPLGAPQDGFLGRDKHELGKSPAGMSLHGRTQGLYGDGLARSHSLRDFHEGRNGELQTFL